MKIQCDVCDKHEASVYCSADEAALCYTCDYTVHHANNLASKHSRFNLVTPSAKGSPLCDLCQEKRAFLFCQQDRAILCNDCDACVHVVNEHTRKHDRFLLTGVKLSAKSSMYDFQVNPLTGNCCDLVPDFKFQSSSLKMTESGSQSVYKSSSVVSLVPENGTFAGNQLLGNLDLESSISEYLMETLPSWSIDVDDLLESFLAPNGFSKQLDGQLLPFMDADVLRCNDLTGSFLHEDTITCPSQVTTISAQFPHVQHYDMLMQLASEQTTSMKGNNNRKLFVDDGFTVPQIFSSQSSKRSRLL